MLVPFWNLKIITPGQYDHICLHHKRVSSTRLNFGLFPRLQTSNRHCIAIYWSIWSISSTMINSPPLGVLFLCHPVFNSSLFTTNSSTRPSTYCISTNFAKFWPCSSSNQPVRGSFCIQNVPRSLVLIGQQPRVSN